MAAAVWEIYLIPLLAPWGDRTPAQRWPWCTFADHRGPHGKYASTGAVELCRMSMNLGRIYQILYVGTFLE